MAGRILKDLETKQLISLHGKTIIVLNNNQQRRSDPNVIKNPFSQKSV